jgi:hypothetical protein
MRAATVLASVVAACTGGEVPALDTMMVTNVVPLTRKIVTAWGSVIDTAAAATVIRPVADRVQLVTIRNLWGS